MSTTATATVTPGGLAPAKSETKPGIKKLNLGGIAGKKASGKTAYPILPDDATGSVASLVGGIRSKADQLDALTTSLEIDKAELVSLAKQFYFANICPSPHGCASISTTGWPTGCGLKASTSSSVPMHSCAAAIPENSRN